jgi:arginyl-tRNA synthetase
MDYIQELNTILRKAFTDAGFLHPEMHIEFNHSKEPERADLQCNQAFTVAKEQGTAPLEIAEKIVSELEGNSVFRKVYAVEPGFINVFLSDTFLQKHLHERAHNLSFTDIKDAVKEKVFLDYGGANVAKPLHVGHLRPAIIGEALKRIGTFMGHEVVGDIHLGDWGLQMGMVITEIKRQHPELPYFDPDFEGEYPNESPVTVEDLETLYPQASARAKADETVMQEARKATVELQNGRRGYRALWKHFLDVSIRDLKENYRNLGVTFDLWLGESDAHLSALKLIAELQEKNMAYESEGALIVDVPKKPEDTKDIPPLILKTSDGSVLYGTTDLGTIYDRVQKYNPQHIIYITDKRQALHFKQVFRVAQSMGLVTEAQCEHVGFGTMNGTDNKPFKTRDGGTLKLEDLIELITNEARKRFDEIKGDVDFEEEEKENIARLVGNATLKFADLSNGYENDYVFDLKRFSSFEGFTGPYLLYSAVRAGAIIEKANMAGITHGDIVTPLTKTERDLIRALLDFRLIMMSTWQQRRPSVLANYVYDLATTFNTFYHDCPVVQEGDEAVRSSRLTLVIVTHAILTKALYLLGMDVPKRM